MSHESLATIVNNATKESIIKFFSGADYYRPLVSPGVH